MIGSVIYNKYNSFRKAKKYAKMHEYGRLGMTLSVIYDFKLFDSKLSHKQNKFPHRKWAKSSIDEVNCMLNKNLL